MAGLTARSHQWQWPHWVWHRRNIQSWFRRSSTNGIGSCVGAGRHTGADCSTTTRKSSSISRAACKDCSDAMDLTSCADRTSLRTAYKPDRITARRIDASRRCAADKQRLEASLHQYGVLYGLACMQLMILCFLNWSQIWTTTYLQTFGTTPITSCINFYLIKLSTRTISDRVLIPFH